ncbi:hypothetical protein LZK73_33785 (plasmid) [Neorhizobium galegae]|nr:hypothetical protein LZK73_33785 [Neorhizobium galegae]
MARHPEIQYQGSRDQCRRSGLCAVRRFGEHARHPRSSRAGDDFAVIVQFFDGDASNALAFINDRVQTLDNASKMPGVAVSIRRAKGASQTEVLMTRFDNVPALLSGFDKPASSATLPPSLRPPPGVDIIADFGDKGTGHTSRTVISSGNVSAAQWSDQRADILRREGFSVELRQARGRGVIALHGRRKNVEADILYTKSKNSAETVEVIAIRQPQS